jgi:hypothetical protein
MQPYLIETDLGHDPDDLFCICHLAELGLPIAAVGLVPGCPEQVALACGLRKQLGLNFLIGVSKPNAKPEHLGVHAKLMANFNWSEGCADGLNEQVFTQALERHPEAQCLAIGPAPGLGKTADRLRGRMMFQGGFLPYSLHTPTRPVEKFLGQQGVQTFNFNGDRRAVDAILRAPLQERRFCGKNVCHAIILTKTLAEQMAPARNIAGEIYLLAIKLYLEYHDTKKMHDPTALACHLHPEIGTWFRGRPQKLGTGWTTAADPQGDFVLADVDHERLWQHLLNRS